MQTFTTPLGIRDAAKLLGVSPNYLRRIERGLNVAVPRLAGCRRRRYSPRLLDDLARRLYGVPLASLVAPAGETP